MNKPEITREIPAKKKPTWKWKRTGRCQPAKCGAACCRLGPVLASFNPKDRKEHLDYSAMYDMFGWFKVAQIKDMALYSDGRTCKNLVGNRCAIQKTKPQCCREFPVVPEHAWFEVVKKVCTYRFVKVRLHEQD